VYVFRFIYTTGKEHSTEHHHQDQKNDREDDIYRLGRIALRVHVKAQRGDRKTYNRQQAIEHTLHKITSDSRKANAEKLFTNTV